MDGAKSALSCSLCRLRKLKCDRNIPCSNCTARSVECVYKPRAKGRERDAAKAGTDSHLKSRIRQLEERIRELTAEKTSATTHASPLQEVSNGVAASLSPAGPRSLEPGHLSSANNQEIFVSGAHWTSLRNQIADIKDQADNLSDEADADPLDPTLEGPLLLEGLGVTVDFPTMVLDLPPKPVADRFVSDYFNSADFAKVILHTTTFEREYSEFWLAPSSVSTTWMALLFGILAMGAQTKLLMQDSPVAENEILSLQAKVFHRHSTACLLLAKYYQLPGQYTVEALLINLQLEYLQSKDGHPGVWLMGSVVIRLAIRLGYHRDSDAYRSISVFQGEMRRRTWALIIQLDALISHQHGLPTMALQYDAKLPRNLLDEDINPGMTELPPSRSEAEVTPILYTITKAKILLIFQDVSQYVSQSNTPQFAEVQSLHVRLRAMHDSISPRMSLGHLQSAVTVDPDLLSRAYSIELFYLKTVSLLHRRHMILSYQDPNFNFSRTCCVEAAMWALHHQAQILGIMESGGRGMQIKWMTSSLEQTDFLNAATIVCLEFSFRKQEHVCTEEQPSVVKYSNHDLIEALEQSQHYLKHFKQDSIQCRQAHRLLSLMLRKYAGKRHSSTNGVHLTGTALDPVPPSLTVPMDVSGPSTGPAQSDKSELSSLSFVPSSMEDMDLFLGNPETADWDLWENFIRGLSVNADLERT